VVMVRAAGVGCATAGTDELTTITKVSKLPPDTDIEYYPLDTTLLRHLLLLV
jgi:hypothetical protein